MTARGPVVAAGCWGLLALLARLGAGSGTGVFDPGYLVMCVLLVAAPMALALPAGRALGAPGWALETVLAWAVLGYLLLFVDPHTLGRGVALLLFLPALYGALASPALWWSARCGGRRRRAQGYVLALVPGGALLLSALGALTLLDGALLVLLAAAAQGLLLTARRPAPPAPAEPPVVAAVIQSGD
jgi:hypothetical protein